MALAGQPIQKAGEDSLGHAPDDGILELICLDLTGLACNLKADRMVAVGAQEMRDRYPTRRGDLWVNPQGRTLVDYEHERAHGNGRKYRGAGDYVIETSHEKLAIQAN